MNCKRQSFIFKVIILIYICSSLFSFIGCKQSIPPINDVDVHSDFSVNFLDVGQGDCIYIRLPDGKNMLIDCGINDSNNENINYIKNYLNEYDVNTIDYFVLTHPDLDHVGNAEEVIKNFSIGKMFIPKIHQAQLQNFQTFEKVLEIIDQKQIEFEYSSLKTQIVGSDYYFAFLSPQNDHRSSYDKILQNFIPTSGDINNLSPIIYFSCFDKRFVFTGDAESQEEKYVIENFKSGIYNIYHSNLEIDLSNIDYLKVSHHGADDASCDEFLLLLNPKNAIISVGNDNYYGHPSTDTLIRLQNICINYNLYRTDQLGTISVYKSDQNFLVQTAKNN